MRSATLALILVAVFCSAFARPPIAWKKTYPWTGNQGANAIAQMQSGGYFLSASQEMEGIGRCFVIRMSSSGDTIWTRTPGVDYYDAKDVTATSDGGCAVVGSRRPMNLYVIKFDSMGNTQWIFVDPIFLTHGQAIKQIWDGSLIAAGHIDPNEYPPSNDLYVVRLDDGGDTLWTRQIGSPYSDWGAYDVISTADSNFLVVGSVDREDAHPGAYCTKLRNDGSAIWDDLYCDNTGFEEAYAACQRPDGNFVVAGEKYFYVSGSDLFVEMLNNSGGEVWTHTFGGTGADIAEGIAATSDNGSIVVGYTTSYGSGGADAWILGLDSQGNQTWDYVIGNALENRLVGITAADDGGYMLCGFTRSEGPMGADIWLIKLCPEGSDAARVVAMTNDTVAVAYRLCHESGAISALTFPNVPSGAVGWVSGEAALNWHVLPNGDGNNGDSIIFTSSIPLTMDSIDTFWVRRPDIPCFVTWAAGCCTDTIGDQYARFDSLQFEGANYGGDLVLRLRIKNAKFIANATIDMWRQWIGTVQLATIPVEPDTGWHEYTFTHRDSHPPTDRYMLSITDFCGRRKLHPELTLIVGVNVPVGNLGAPNVQTFSFSAFPNPFNPSATLSFSLSHAAHATFTVYDVIGRKVQVLHDGFLDAGEHRFTFNGSALPTGLYFARLHSGTNVATQKLLLLK